MAVYVPVPVPQRTAQPVLTNMSESDFNNPFANARFTAQAKGGVHLQQLLSHDYQTRQYEMGQWKAMQQQELNTQEARLRQLQQQQQAAEQARKQQATQIASLNDPTPLSNQLLYQKAAQQGSVTVGDAVNADRQAHELWRQANEIVHSENIAVDPAYPPRGAFGAPSPFGGAPTYTHSPYLENNNFNAFNNLNNNPQYAQYAAQYQGIPAFANAGGVGNTYFGTPYHGNIGF